MISCYLHYDRSLEQREIVYRRKIEMLQKMVTIQVTELMNQYDRKVKIKMNQELIRMMDKFQQHANRIRRFNQQVKKASKLINYSYRSKQQQVDDRVAKYNDVSRSVGQLCQKCKVNDMDSCLEDQLEHISKIYEETELGFKDEKLKVSRSFDLYLHSQKQQYFQQQDLDTSVFQDDQTVIHNQQSQHQSNQDDNNHIEDDNNHIEDDNNHVEDDNNHVEDDDKENRDKDNEDIEYNQDTEDNQEIEEIHESSQIIKHFQNQEDKQQKLDTTDVCQSNQNDDNNNQLRQKIKSGKLMIQNTKKKKPKPKPKQTKIIKDQKSHQQQDDIFMLSQSLEVEKQIVMNSFLTKMLSAKQIIKLDSCKELIQLHVKILISFLVVLWMQIYL